MLKSDGEDGRNVDSIPFVQTMRAGMQGCMEDEPESALDTTLKPSELMIQQSRKLR